MNPIGHGHGRCRRFRIAALCVIAALLVPMGIAADTRGRQAGEEAAVKAAFLYNFVKFTEWKELSPNAPIVVCVVADRALWTAMVDAVKGQQIGGRTLDVRQPAGGAAWSDCQVLFVGGAAVRRSSSALNNIRTRPVLTVSDAEAFAQDDGIIEFYREADRMRFAINVEAANRAGLRISSRLLGLAKIVGSDRDR